MGVTPPARCRCESCPCTKPAEYARNICRFCRRGFHKGMK